jgi:hypothetical protein
MYVEYAKEKLGAISFVLSALGLIVALTGFQGLVVISAVCVGGFMLGWPLHTAHRAWHREEGPERWIQTIIPLAMFADGIWAITNGLVTKGPTAMSENLGLVSIDFAFFFAFLVVVQFIPRWGKSRKQCPECLNSSHAEARACACGYRWAPRLEENSANPRKQPV